MLRYALLALLSMLFAIVALWLIVRALILILIGMVMGAGFAAAAFLSYGRPISRS